MACDAILRHLPGCRRWSIFCCNRQDKTGIVLTLHHLQKTAVFLLGLGFWHSAFPQTDPCQQESDGTGINIETETSPLHDSVLSAAPEHLSLAFPYAVRLLKLTLHNQLHDWIDISFRYDPSRQKNFLWEIPELGAATYYTTDWAILGENDRLIRGSFSFSFGSDAEAPSVTKAVETLLLESGNGGPNLRYVTPPRTKIIINQDPPRYDPPFTIKLEQQRSDVKLEHVSGEPC